MINGWPDGLGQRGLDKLLRIKAKIKNIFVLCKFQQKAPSEEEVSIIRGKNCSNMWIPFSLFSSVPIVCTQQAHLKMAMVAIKRFWISLTYGLPLTNADLAIITTESLVFQQQQCPWQILISWGDQIATWQQVDYFGPLPQSGFFLIGINTYSRIEYDFSACHALPGIPSVVLLNV